MTTLDTEIQAGGDATATASTGATRALPRSQRGVDPAGGPRRIRVGIIGATGYVGARAGPAPRAPPERRARRARRAAAATTTRSTAIHPHLAATGLTIDAELPPATPCSWRCPTAPAAALVPRPRRGRHRDHRPGTRLPPPRPGRLPALVRLRAPAARPPRRRRSTACRSSIGPSSTALVDAAGRDRRRARLLPDRDAPRARAAGARRASSATSWSTPRAASRAPAARPRPT